MTTSCNSFCLKEFDQTATPSLASNLFVDPKSAEVYPAVMRASVGTADNLFVLSQPNGQGNFDAVSIERSRMIELFEFRLREP